MYVLQKRGFDFELLNIQLRKPYTYFQTIEYWLLNNFISQKENTSTKMYYFFNEEVTVTKQKDRQRNTEERS
jgi:hypothetical protein